MRLPYHDGRSGSILTITKSTDLRCEAAPQLPTAALQRVATMSGIFRFQERAALSPPGRAGGRRAQLRPGVTELLECSSDLASPWSPPRVTLKLGSGLTAAPSRQHERFWERRRFVELCELRCRIQADCSSLVTRAARRARWAASLLQG